MPSSFDPFCGKPVLGGSRRRWAVLIPLATALAIIFLYCLTIPNVLSAQPLDLSGIFPVSSGKLDELPSTSSAEIPADTRRDDFGLLLRPEAHIHRAPRVSKLEWNITKGERRPDGVAKQVFLINDEFPAPAIEARSGDQLIITVNNHLEDTHEHVAIHWHGLHVSNDMDGAAGVTQCSVGHSSSFTYTLQIPETQAGTFWYHAHFETQRADGLYGAIVIHPPAENDSSEAKTFGYEEDQVLMVGDWFHRTAHQVLASYDTGKNFKIEEVPDSILLNGKGNYNCSMAVRARPVDCEDTPVLSLRLKSPKTRLRIANTGSSTGISLSLAGYSMTLIKVDGGADVEAGSPMGAIGVLYPGERMDIVVERTAMGDDDEPRFIVALDRETMQFRNLALKATQHFSIKSPAQLSNSLPPASDEKLDLTKISGAKLPASSLAAEADETVLLYTNIAFRAIDENRPKGMVNNTSWSPLHNNTQLPLLASDRNDWPEKPQPFVPAVQESHWVDLIINNMDDKGHPFHLHGHAFYVLARYQAARLGQYGAYNPYATPGKLPGDVPINLETPVRKDTIYVPSQGFVLLRFRAERVGLWLLHCHVLWHQSVGMGIALQVGGASTASTEQELRTSVLDSCQNLGVEAK